MAASRAWSVTASPPSVPSWTCTAIRGRETTTGGLQWSRTASNDKSSAAVGRALELVRTHLVDPSRSSVIVGPSLDRASPPTVDPSPTTCPKSSGASASPGRRSTDFSCPASCDPSGWGLVDSSQPRRSQTSSVHVSRSRPAEPPEHHAEWDDSDTFDGDEIGASVLIPVSPILCLGAAKQARLVAAVPDQRGSQGERAAAGELDGHRPRVLDGPEAPYPCRDGGGEGVEHVAERGADGLGRRALAGSRRNAATVASARTASLLARARRSHPRTVVAGRSTTSATRRCPNPSAAASSAVPTVWAVSRQRGNLRAHSTTWVTRQDRHRVRRGR